jgi:ribosomal protein S18 acetylase RimI-like enzyme
MKIIIRSAQRSDEVAIKTLLASIQGVWQDKWRDSAISVALESAGELALVALKKDRVIGFCCVHDAGFRAYLSELAVAESEQKKGIGSMLLEKAEAMLAERGCLLIIADAYPPAERFYKKLGWGTPSSVLISKLIDKKEG